MLNVLEGNKSPNARFGDSLLHYVVIIIEIIKLSSNLACFSQLTFKSLFNIAADYFSNHAVTKLLISETAGCHSFHTKVLFGRPWKLLELYIQSQCVWSLHSASISPVVLSNLMIFLFPSHLMSPLFRYQDPADDWTEHISSSGKKYYYNCRTEVSQWEKPKDLLERQAYLKESQHMS